MISKETIEKYIGKNTNAEILKTSTDIKVHSLGKTPDNLSDLRPNENYLVKEYRKRIFKPKTKMAFGKVFTLLKKIQKASDFVIDYPTEYKGAIIKDKDLKSYCEYNYPFWDSLTNYIFNVVLKKVINEPNGVILVAPLTFDINETEYLEPYASVYDTSEVVEFIENELCVLKHNNQYWFIDKEEIIKVATDKEGILKVKEKYTFDFGYMPCFKLGGRVAEFKNGITIYESFLSDAIPSWDEALRLYSDHQANLALHIHPEKWVYENSECSMCKGTAKLPNVDGVLVDCKSVNKKCNGKGYGSSPYGVHVVNPTNAMEGQVPTPPLGYINKPIELVKVLRDEIEKQINEGYDALGLSFLSDVGANQSGIAKEYDRDESNSFLFDVASHICENILKPIYFFTNEWRYQSLSVEDRNYNLPTIHTPTEFDALTNRIISERLKNAITSNYDYMTRLNLQIQYAKKEFGEQSNQWRIIETIGKLNPLPDKNEDEKMTILANKGTTIANYILSGNIDSFVYRAVNEVKDFLILDYSQKRKILLEYADEIAKENIKNIIPLEDSNG